ncbi:MAG TPA: SDR family oxidoreductase [Ignavibacteria bacterium]|nr:SDR family oxidoreductase [Ignavibacteria bacterium]
MKNKTIFITGATSGIGLSCAGLFAEKGANLILAGRRKERLKEIETDLKKKFKTKSLIFQLDVRKYSSVKKAVDGLPEKWKNIDVLVNNAGLSRGLDKLHEGRLDDWEEMIDTNIKGLLYVSRMVIPLMAKRNSGHIINIGSIAGHEVYPKGSVYCATKHAVDAITKGMRLDLVDSNIRVTTIDPGMVETEFSLVRFRGNKDKAKVVYTGITPLTPGDIADAVFYAASRPENVVVAEMLLLPNKQASSTIVFRNS